MSDEVPFRIEVPFTAEQVDALNVYQHLDQYHEFTCPGHAGGGDRTLVATRSGWVCCHCSYTQNWAHHRMVELGQNEITRRKFRL